MLCNELTLQTTLLPSQLLDCMLFFVNCGILLVLVSSSCKFNVYQFMSSDTIVCAQNVYITGWLVIVNKDFCLLVSKDQQFFLPGISIVSYLLTTILAA